MENSNNPTDKDEAALENKDTTRTSPGLRADLPDSPDDEKHLQPEEVIFELPDVADIPGQEHIRVPNFGEMADTTISSDDEEGVSIFEEEIEEDDTRIIMGTDADVTPEETKGLQTTGEDRSILEAASLDNSDDEDDPLNEGSSDTSISGQDLDTPGSEDDNPNEEIGEEDEENNSYSLGGDEQEDATESKQGE